MIHETRSGEAAVVAHFSAVAAGDLAAAMALLAPDFRFLRDDITTNAGGYMALIEADQSLSGVRTPFFGALREVNPWTVLAQGRSRPAVIVADAGRIVSISAVSDWARWLCVAMAS